MFYLSDIRGIPLMIEGIYWKWSDWFVAKHAMRYARILTGREICVVYIPNE